MDSSGVVYARIPGGGTAALAAAVEEARRITGQSSPLGMLCGEEGKHAFAVVDRWGGADNMPGWAEGPDLTSARELAELSRIVGEVVAFYQIDEGATMGIYGAWKDGKLVRNLLWYDYAWQVVEGEPQPWEAGLFTPEARAKALEDAEWDKKDPAEVHAVFDRGCVVPGASQPHPGGLIRFFCASFLAPLYGFQPWPPRKELVAALPKPSKGK